MRCCFEDCQKPDTEDRRGVRSILFLRVFVVLFDSTGDGDGALSVSRPEAGAEFLTAVHSHGQFGVGVHVGDQHISRGEVRQLLRRDGRFGSGGGQFD